MMTEQEKILREGLESTVRNDGGWKIHAYEIPTRADAVQTPDTPAPSDFESVWNSPERRRKRKELIYTGYDIAREYFDLGANYRTASQAPVLGDVYTFEQIQDAYNRGYFDRSQHDDGLPVIGFRKFLDGLPQPPKGAKHE